MSEETGSITIKKQDLWKYSTFVLIAFILIGAVFMFTSPNGNTTNTGTTGTTPDTQPSVVSASVDDDAVLGDPNAPMTIIEFSDYQCPFCRKFWTETYPQIKSQYVDSGKVKIVFRDFTLTSIHPMAQSSAEAVECVREKGGDAAYFKYHDKIFSEQNILDSGSSTGAVTKTVVYTNDDLKTWASEIGYDIGSCLDSGKYKSEVQKDLSDGSRAGVQGTPGFIIMKSDSGKGTLLAGAYPFSAFQQVIESEL